MQFLAAMLYNSVNYSVTPVLLRGGDFSFHVFPVANGNFWKAFWVAELGTGPLFFGYWPLFLFVSSAVLNDVHLRPAQVWF